MLMDAGCSGRRFASILTSPFKACPFKRSRPRSPKPSTCIWKQWPTCLLMNNGNSCRAGPHGMCAPDCWSWRGCMAFAARITVTAYSPMIRRCLPNRSNERGFGASLIVAVSRTQYPAGYRHPSFPATVTTRRRLSTKPMSRRSLPLCRSRSKPFAPRTHRTSHIFMRLSPQSCPGDPRP